ncbi:hypothetical protein SAMN04487897_10950 [Paenibacillus sp. yr247]|uniref:hypothetical protein n=1 Tax=Paenibacillus sp. yr247 TaxID=1761880 RepID=UPI00087EDD7C|nr:hypothetical protein [Paenibacillus sp. yr247]SDO16016.1 hypothetical protein SAMN04487897_10950 [Paenibacillus sp. yr247]
MQKLHIILSFIATCTSCNRRNEIVIKDFGLLTYTDLEMKLGEHDYTVSPIKCTKCNTFTLPSIMRMFDKLQKVVVSEGKIGIDVPVINGDKGDFVYSRTEEEQAEIDRGIAKWKQHAEEHAEAFWQAFEDYSAAHWNTLLMELSKEEYESAYHGCGLALLGPNASVFKYRQDSNKQLTDDCLKRQFWRAANVMMYDRFVTIGIESWNIKKDIKLFGRERVRFLILHLPIPEELEGLRSQAIGELIKRENTDQAYLYQRIEQLSNRLEQANGKANRYRQEVTDLNVKLAAAYDTIEDLKSSKVEVRQETGQTQKIARLKALIADLRLENRELREKLPLNDSTPPGIEVERTDPAEQIVEADLNLLQGKTVAFFGGWKKQNDSNNPCTVLFHDARKQDPEFYRILRDAEFYVILWEFISHESMWEIREYAADQGKSVHFVKGMNIERGLMAIVSGMNHRNY